MTRCQFCGAWNADADHHCEVCGRMPSGQERAPRRRRLSRGPLPARAAELPPQPSLQGQPGDRLRRPGSARGALPAGKVIPFEWIAPDRLPVPDPLTAPPERPTRRTQARKTTGRPGVPRQPAAVNQPSLPFRRPAAEPEPEPLRDAPVAPPRIRCAAAGVDAVLLLLAVAAFAATFYLMGGRIALAPRAALPWGVVFLLLVLFYRIFWCVLKGESVGMQFFRLRLLNFDGYEPEPAQRVVRLVAACLSVAAGGLGLLWALVDEEKLTWHDHISKTFPTEEPFPTGPLRRA